MGAVRKVRSKPAERKAPLSQMRGRLIVGKFDSAQTGDNNRKHWQQADGMSADAALTPAVRQALRNRSRYEVQNNSYARGIVTTLANDCIGTGPRLQILGLPSANEIERAWAAWARAVSLPEKLRTMRMARGQDGEGFAILTTNPLVQHVIQLDLRLIEAEQVASVWGDESAVDGIRIDRSGNPVSYSVLKEHPGSGGMGAFAGATITVPAEFMIHDFRAERPGQHRGIPEITPALPLFAQLRRFTLAVLGAAETAANVAAVMYTDSPPDDVADNSVDAMDEIELARNRMLTLPAGWKMGQIEPTQPATTYGDFKKEILSEIARCLSMPYNKAAGDSSGYNYASGRLDHQTYFRGIEVDRSLIEGRVLDRILALWLREYGLSFGLLGDVEHQWFWDSQPHVDPVKEANAQETRLRTLTTSYAQEYASAGQDWEQSLRQIAKERELMRELGLIQSVDASPDEEDVDEQEEGTEE